MVALPVKRCLKAADNQKRNKTMAFESTSGEAESRSAGPQASSGHVLQLGLVFLLPVTKHLLHDAQAFLFDILLAVLHGLLSVLVLFLQALGELLMVCLQFREGILLLLHRLGQLIEVHRQEILDLLLLLGIA